VPPEKNTDVFTREVIMKEVSAKDFF